MSEKDKDKDKEKEAGRGLEGVVVGDSAIAFIDGEKGELLYRGYSIADLAERSTFAETAHLLWVGELPDKRAAAELEAALAAARRLPPGVLDQLRSMPRNALPIDVLRSFVSLLASYEKPAPVTDPAALLIQAVRLTGATAAIIAAFHRVRSQLPVLDPRPELNHAADFLWQLQGEVPARLSARAFDTALILHMEHGHNASTFAARVTASTLADLPAACTAAIAALKGPLHGGANEKVMDMLRAVGRPERAVDWVEERIARREKLMGFGHRVYKTEDPRAAVLRRLSEELNRARGSLELYRTSRAIEEAVTAALGSKGIAVNVDFYSASVYHALGIPADLFTPVFALARMVGWTAHVLEQYADNRLIRPRARYTGPGRRKYQPIADR